MLCYSAWGCQISSKSDHALRNYDVIYRFSRRRQSAMLYCFGVIADHPRSAFRGLNSVFKSLIRRINSCGDTAMYRFWRFGLKLPIHAPFWGVLGEYFPHMTSLIDQTPERTVLGRKHVVWAIQRKNQCDGSTWACNEKKYVICNVIFGDLGG